MINQLITGTPFTRAERAALRSLRAGYEPAQHLFTKRELAQLRFLHWRVHSSAWDRAMDHADDQERMLIAAPDACTWALEIPTWTPGLIA